MFWLIGVYFIVGLMCNFGVSVIVALMLGKRCDEKGGSYEQMFNKHFLVSDKWLETQLPIPIVLYPVVKTIFFPFNVASMIKCYKDAVCDLNKEDE